MRIPPLLAALLACAACSPVIINRPYPRRPAPPVVRPPVPVREHREADRRNDRRRDDVRRDGLADRRIDLAIDRAYRELLERAPDPEGREHYRKLLREGLAEGQMRDRIRKSVEYRVTLPDAKTRRAYRKVLGREPDPGGLVSYRKKIVDKGWTERDVENDLRRSAEYRERHP